MKWATWMAAYFIIAVDLRPRRITLDRRRWHVFCWFCIIIRTYSKCARRINLKKVYYEIGLKCCSILTARNIAQSREANTAKMKRPKICLEYKSNMRARFFCAIEFNDYKRMLTARTHTVQHVLCDGAISEILDGFAPRICDWRTCSRALIVINMHAHTYAI